MEHHAPHPGAAFEGYYNKFDLPSGAHLVLVTSKINRDRSKANALTITYVPPNASKSNIYQKEIFPETMEMQRIDKSHAFRIDVPGIGYAKWNADSSTEYEFEYEEFSFRANTTSRIAWSANTDTPEGMLVKLPLPLHWHVQSLGSQCKFSMQISGIELPTADMSGEAIIHQEKNWAYSFPSAHMWIQAREADKSFCCAGGQILGMEAFLLGYRSKDLTIDLRPPFALRFLGVGPCMSYKKDWNDRSFELSIQSFRRKITVKATAPQGSFFSFSPPFPEGHRENYLGQSFQARIEVKIYQAGWFSPWRLLCEDLFENSSLEFGGAYYLPAGSKERFN